MGCLVPQAIGGRRPLIQHEPCGDAEGVFGATGVGLRRAFWWLAEERSHLGSRDLCVHTHEAPNTPSESQNTVPAPILTQAHVQLLSNLPRPGRF